MSDQL